jgi:hypothetical protein
LKVSAYLRDPKAVLFHLPSFLLEALGTANPSRVPKYALVFSEVSVAQSLVFGVVICWWLLVLVITDIGVNEHERLFNITQRFYCCSTSHNLTFTVGSSTMRIIHTLRRVWRWPLAYRWVVLELTVKRAHSRVK